MEPVVKRWRVRVTGTGTGTGWPEHRITGRHRDERIEVPADAMAVVESATLDRVDLSAQRFRGYLARGATFTGCSFAGTVWGGGVFGDVPQVEYRDCDFTRADLHAAGPRFARFTGCRFSDADLTDWYAMCAEFVDCTFTGTLTGVKFSAEPWGVARNTARKLRKRNAFTGNDFTGAQLVDCTVAGGIDVDANRWPADHLIIRDAQRRIQAAAAALPPDERVLRPGAMSKRASRLAIFSMGAYAMQRDLVLHPSDVGAELADLP
jgi:hypothetical protein